MSEHVSSRPAAHVPTTAEARAVVERYCAAMSSDIPTMADLLDDDFRRYGIETGWQPMGKAGYLRMAENYVTAFPDTRWEVRDLVADGARVAVRVVESGTFSRPWTVGDVTLPPNGEAYEMDGAVFFLVNERGTISEYTYIHTGTFVSHYAGAMTDAFYVAYVDAFFSHLE